MGSSFFFFRKYYCFYNETLNRFQKGEAMKGAESLVLRAIIVDGMEDKIKSLQKDYETIEWDSVNIHDLQHLAAHLDQLVIMFGKIILNKSTKLKLE